MKSILVFILMVLCFASCRENIATNVPIELSEKYLQSYLQEMLETTHGNIPGVSMSVISPHLKSNWSGAAGFDSKEKTDTLEMLQPFRIASVTKTFVAVAILRLHEMDSLHIDDSISEYISDIHLKLLTDDGYIPQDISIRHCLHHTSGLYDYAVGDKSYIDYCKSNPTKRWSRTEQIQWAMDKGEPIDKPGATYRYSDTGYVILGEIIEKYFDGDLALGLRPLLKYDDLGLKNTWLETLEPPRSDKPVVHRYLGREDYTTADPSGDLYGGGGLMSTTMDLSKFIHAVFNGEVFENNLTLDLMKSKASLSKEYDFENDEKYKDYRLGMWQVEIYGHKAYMHSGLWGVVLIHVPALNSSFAANYTNSRSLRPLKKAILLVKNLTKNSN